MALRILDENRALKNSNQTLNSSVVLLSSNCQFIFLVFLETWKVFKMIAKLQWRSRRQAHGNWDHFLFYFMIFITYSSVSRSKRLISFSTVESECKLDLLAHLHRLIQGVLRLSKVLKLQQESVKFSSQNSGANCYFLDFLSFCVCATCPCDS